MVVREAPLPSCAADGVSALPLCDIEGVVVRSSHAGGGDGLFAARGFSPGERVVGELALGQLELEDPEGAWTLQDLHEAIVGAGWRDELLRGESQGVSLFRGPPAGRLALDYHSWAEAALAASEPAERERAAEAMLIVAFNAYATKTGGKSGRAVFPLISKANHSCVPNGTVLAHEDGTGEIWCLRSIEPGAEVVVSYLSDWQLARPVAQRRDHFFSTWEFECSCPRCAADVDDARRFACPVQGCSGYCAAPREQRSTSGDSSAPFRCSLCGVFSSAEVVVAWREAESKIEELVEGLPASLYSAWASCEEFAAEHPDHWLVAVWKRHLAAHTEREAEDEEDPAEARALRNEASEHFAAARRCVERIIGHSLDDPRCSGVALSPAE